MQPRWEIVDLKRFIHGNKYYTETKECKVSSVTAVWYNKCVHIMDRARQLDTELQVITLVRVLHPSGPEVVRVIDRALPTPAVQLYEWGPGRVRRAA